MGKRDQLSLLDQLASQSGQISRSTKRLQAIGKWIGWQPLYEIGRRIDKTGPQGGQPRTPAHWMIRGLFLKHLYQLSDPQLEDQLIDRLSFRRFVGLPLEERVPDFTTFWRFQEALAQEGLVDELFEEINRQLDDQGLLLKQGTVVDATIINSSNRPLSNEKRMSLEKEPSPQIDTDANATCKGGTWYFGYKGHIGMDAGSKLIRQVHFTPASTHDSQALAELISDDERSLFGDKAYSNDSVKHQARQSGWYYGILDKAKKGHPLSTSQKKRNKRHRRVRRQVEHAFAAIKDRYGMRLAQCKNKLRNQAQFMMKTICWNIERSMKVAKKDQKITLARAR